MIPYRDYQAQIVTDIQAAWAAGARNVLAVQATRTGKTVVFSGILSQLTVPAIAIAHRQELVSQTSLALARCGVPHRIEASRPVVKRAILRHMKEVGANFVDPRAQIAVASVDTLIARIDTLAPWLATVGLWVVDEGHHIIRGNKWGKVLEHMPQALGLGVTATPGRASGEGLGRHADGMFDQMVVGLQMREAIEQGWLLDYTIYAPVSDFHRPDRPEDIGASGELKQKAVRAAVRSSHIVGDVVEHYQRIAPDKQGVVYASDTETAADIANQFNREGIRAEVVTAKTPDAVRASIVAQFEKRELRILVNVDLFGEGTDLPDLEVVIMARPTESLALYCQQFNRASTISLPDGVPDTIEARLAAIAASDKPRAIIIDHVGNVLRFNGPPDAVHNQRWTLDAREKRSRGIPDDVIPLRNCLNPRCMAVYERIHRDCPFCGHYSPPASRSAPEFVDGDLTELDAETLAEMRGEVEKIDKPADEYRAELAANHCPPIGQAAHIKRHLENQDTQDALRASMAWWAGHHKEAGRRDAEIYRRFYFRFGVDASTAQALNTKDALRLAERINDDLIAGVPL